MRPALLVLGYALAVAWLMPPVLSRLTARGISARLGLAAWLTAMASVLACATVAVGLLVSAAVSGWSGLAEAVCRSVAGQACAPVIYRSAIFEIAAGAAAVVAALTAAGLAWRCGCSVQRAQRRTRAHAELARLAGRSLTRNRLPGSSGAALIDPVVLDAPQPVAYCVAGRPATIVLTTGALAVLDPAQLSAVIAHEQAHLAGRHHLLIALTRGLAATVPGVPLLRRGPGAVARLAEMRADDAAARCSGRRALITALLAMGTGTAVPAAAPAARAAVAALAGTAVAGLSGAGPALGATACAVSDRVQRLLEPPRRGRRTRHVLALIAVIVLLAALSGLVAALAGPLSAHGIRARW